MNQKFLARNQFQSLIDTLLDNGYSVMGPKEQDGAITYSGITNVKQLPIGITDSQQAGQYTLNQTKNQRFFSWASASQSIKPFCFSPTEKLWQSSKNTEGNLEFTEQLPASKPTALIGAKSCDLAALKLQDKHFLEQDYVDPYYEKRRNNLFLIAVDCSHPAETCFCHSTGDGPSVSDGFDISLTELDDGFLVTAGSVRGQLIIDNLPTSDAEQSQITEKSNQQKAAIEKQTRKLPSCDVANTLKDRPEHSHWDEIGKKCLACSNCTSVCPSCFCHSESDESTLNLNESTHIRQWDSCFNHGHSYIHGIVIRSDSKNRYRQWLTHKFSSWFEQYGRSGCTGCGRCISWCPVGIDVTEELKSLCGESDV